MTDEERRDVVRRLSILVRRMGWEDLIEVQITPEEAELGKVDERLARALVAQVYKLVVDMAVVEIHLMERSETIDFKPDTPALLIHDDLGPQRFERGMRLDRQGLLAKFPIYVDLTRNLRELEAAFDLGD